VPLQISLQTPLHTLLHSNPNIQIPHLFDPLKVIALKRVKPPEYSAKFRDLDLALVAYKEGTKDYKSLYIDVVKIPFDTNTTPPPPPLPTGA
jgi:hypothetical protein